MIATADSRVCLAIPARIGSQRLKRKMLLELDGKSLIRRVWEKAVKLEGPKLDVVVLTDSSEIQRHVSDFGGTSLLTSPELRNGTERIASVLTKLDHDIFVNLQGDDPNVPTELIDEFIQFTSKNVSDKFATTLYAHAKNLASVKSPMSVKMILGADNVSNQFSRAIIPFPKNGFEDLNGIEPRKYRLHIGLYGYNRKHLKKFIECDETDEEIIEGLEQLRFIHMNVSFKAMQTDYCPTPIDIESDIERALTLIRNGFNEEN